VLGEWQAVPCFSHQPGHRPQHKSNILEYRIAGLYVPIAKQFPKRADYGLVITAKALQIASN
jgi:hypothetical protein